MKDGTPSIVFADMDGTFLASDKSVPERNLALLDLLFEQGVPFVPCTGRPVRAVPEVVRAHPACTYAVGSNGAVIWDVVRGERLLTRSLDKEAVLALYERVGGLDVTFDVFCDGEVYSERARYEAMGDYGLNPAMLAMLRRVRKPTDLMVPELVARAEAVEKVTCFWKAEADRDGLLSAIRQSEGLSFAQGDPKDFEMQAPDASKGAALVWLCDYLGCDQARSVAFGDLGNDVSLLVAAGIGVAMANASADVLAASDEVTLTNDECGVAAYLEGLLV